MGGPKGPTTNAIIEVQPNDKMRIQIAEMEEQNKRLAGAAAAVAIEQAALDEQLAVLHGVLSAFTIENAALRNALLQLHNYAQVLQAWCPAP